MDGQGCDENKKKRSTEVHIQCCEGKVSQTDKSSPQMFDNINPAVPKVTLNAIVEPDTCHYQALVCTPLLCSKYTVDNDEALTGFRNGIEDAKSSAEAKKSKAAKKLASMKSKQKEQFSFSSVQSLASEGLGAQLVEVMKGINSTCLIKQEEWWTYELCFNNAVRQVRFNLEQTALPDGTLVQKQVNRIYFNPFVLA